MSVIDERDCDPGFELMSTRRWDDGGVEVETVWVNDPNLNLEDLLGMFYRLALAMGYHPQSVAAFFDDCAEMAVAEG